MTARLHRHITLLVFVFACSLNMLAQRVRTSNAAFATDSLIEKIASTPLDTTTVAATDTIPNDTVPNDTVPQKRDELEAPVVYQSADSMVWYKNGNAYLYGEGKINYQKIELKANEITIDLETSSVYAQGTTDSLGTTTGRPVFADGATPYESETMSYNFKSRKGFINNVTTHGIQNY